LGNEIYEPHNETLENGNQIMTNKGTSLSENQFDFVLIR